MANQRFFRSMLASLALTTLFIPNHSRAKSDTPLDDVIRANDWPELLERVKANPSLLDTTIEEPHLPTPSGHSVFSFVATKTRPAQQDIVLELAKLRPTSLTHIDKNGESPLSILANWKREYVLADVVRAYPEVLGVPVDREKSRLVELVVKSDKSQLLNTILKISPEQIHVVTDLTQVSLAQLAVRSGALGTLKIILAADPEQSTHQDIQGKNALHDAVGQSDLKITTAILQNLPPPALTQRDANGLTPIQTPVHGNRAFQKVLIGLRYPHLLEQASAWQKGMTIRDELRTLLSAPQLRGEQNLWTAMEPAPRGTGADRSGARVRLEEISERIAAKDSKGATQTDFDLLTLLALIPRGSPELATPDWTPAELMMLVESYLHTANELPLIGDSLARLAQKDTDLEQFLSNYQTFLARVFAERAAAEGRPVDPDTSVMHLVHAQMQVAKPKALAEGDAGARWTKKLAALRGLWTRLREEPEFTDLGNDLERQAETAEGRTRIAAGAARFVAASQSR